MPSLRTIAGALLYDWPHYARAMRRRDWLGLHNRHEVIERDAVGVRPRWQFTSELHIANVFPSTARVILREAARDWPIVLSDAAPATAERPDVTFLIGHRGRARLPHLLATLRSIAAQRDAAIECIVVEQSNEREIEAELPSWVRYVHTPLPQRDLPYCRSWAFNVGAHAARGEVLILHDNDFLVPERYAAEALARVRDGHEFVDLKRFEFYLSEADSARLFASGRLSLDVAATIVQNLQGGSVVAARDAYFAIGGFDEAFIGWGGEDNDFWERAEAHGGVYAFGYLPLVHLFHAPQPGKLMGDDAPAVKRYRELMTVPAAERIARLRARPIGAMSGPSV